MPAIVPRSIGRLSSASDPKRELLDAIGPAIDKIRVFGSNLLVATYIPPDRIGSIIMTDKTKEEALWMGSVGLVLKKGPWAFQSDEELKIDWKSQDVQIGEWILFRFSDAWEQHFNGVSVRFVPDNLVKGVIETPQLMSNIPMFGGE